MQLKTGQMMDHFDEYDHFIICVTSNLRADGTAIMVSSVTAPLSEKHPTMAKAIGGFIQAHCGSCGTYSFRCEAKVGLFQHGFVPKDSPHLELVSKAAKQFKELAEANPEKSYALESPARKEHFWLVEGILRTLPDNVHVWLP